MMGARAWHLAGFASVLAAGLLGCGTHVIELPGASVDAAAEVGANADTPDAAGGTPSVVCKDQQGPQGTCTTCYFADGSPPATNCKPIAIPSCPAGTGPIEGQCTRCETFLQANQGKINTCLTCKPWDKGATGACRSCVWGDVPAGVPSCQQCMDAKGQSSDTCDEILKKYQMVL
jgi:hypothetical protein